MLKRLILIPICLFCIATTGTLSVPEAGGASIGSFERVGSLITRRYEPSVALLHDGRVVVFGGHPHDSFDPVPNIEIFDPTTGKFEPAGEMAIPRDTSQSLTLDDGRVLVAGGSTGGAENDYYSAGAGIELVPAGSSIGVSSEVDAIEVFDPVEKTSSIVGSAEGLEIGAPIALLPNNRVLFNGRPTTEWEYVSDDGEMKEVYRPGRSQVFDLATASFLPTAPQIATRDRAYLAPLDDGRVLLGGGYEPTGSGEKRLLVAEIFDPASMSYSRTGDSLFPREWSSATTLPNGQVLIAGGVDYKANGNTNTAELFDPITGTFSRTGDMNVARGGHDAVLLGDGRVLITGGDSPYFRSAEVYDYQTGRFSRVGSMHRGHENGAAVGLANGSALFLAGGDWSGNIGRAAEVFDPGKKSAIFGTPLVKVVTRLAGRYTVARFKIEVRNAGDKATGQVRVCVGDYRYLFRSRFERNDGFEHCRFASTIRPGGVFSKAMTLWAKKPVAKDRIVQLPIYGSMKGGSDRLATEVDVKIRRAR